MRYSKTAGSAHPALIVFLIDISASMAAKMPDGRARHEVVQEALQAAISQLIELSVDTTGKKVLPRYRILMLAYSEKVWDLFGGIKDITFFAQDEFAIDELPPMSKTNPALAFEYVKQTLEEDIDGWSKVHRAECPAPIVIHLTDAEINEEFEDPEPYADAIKQISVEDGNVLLSNIYISAYLRVGVKNFENWEGFYREDSTGDPYGDKLLRTSSILPLSYLGNLVDRFGLKVRPETLMFYPGINLSFIRGALVLAGSVAGIGNPQHSSSSDHGLDRNGDVYSE